MRSCQHNILVRVWLADKSSWWFHSCNVEEGFDEVILITQLFTVIFTKHKIIHHFSYNVTGTNIATADLLQEQYDGWAWELHARCELLCVRFRQYVLELRDLRAALGSKLHTDCNFRELHVHIPGCALIWHDDGFSCVFLVLKYADRSVCRCLHSDLSIFWNEFSRLEYCC